MSILAEQGRGLLSVKAAVERSLASFFSFFFLQPEVATPPREALPNAKIIDEKVRRHQVSGP